MDATPDPRFADLDPDLAASARRALATVAVTGPALRARLDRPFAPSRFLGSPAAPAALDGPDWQAICAAPLGSAVLAVRSSPASGLAEVLPGVWRRVDDWVATDLLVTLAGPEAARDALAFPAAGPPEGMRAAEPSDLDPGVEVPGGAVFVEPLPPYGASAVFVRWGAVASAFADMTVPMLETMLAALSRVEIEAALSIG